MTLLVSSAGFPMATTSRRRSPVRPAAAAAVTGLALLALAPGVALGQQQDTSVGALAGLSVAAAMIVAVAALALAVGLWMAARRRAAGDAVRIAELKTDLARSTAVLGSAPDGYFEWSAGSGLETCSPGLAALLGVPAVAVKTFHDLAPSFERKDFDALEVAAKALRDFRKPFTLQIRTGSGRALDARGWAATGSGDDPVSFMIWFHDISALRDRTAQLQNDVASAHQQRDHLQEVLDLAPFPAWRRRQDLSIGWVNIAYGEAVETDPETAVREGIELLPGPGPRHAQALAALATQTGATQLDKRRFAVGGDRRTFEIIETPLAGKGTVGIARDITGREDATGELTRHTEAQASVMDRLPSAIAIFGPDKRLSFFNEAFCACGRWTRTGWRRNQAMAKSWRLCAMPGGCRSRPISLLQGTSAAQYTSVMEPLEEQQHLPDGRTLRVVTAPHSLGACCSSTRTFRTGLEMERSRNTLAAVQLATLDHLFEGVAVFGSDGRLKLSNAAFAKIWDLDPPPWPPSFMWPIWRKRCRVLFSHSEAANWPALKEKIVARTLDRTARSARMERPDGMVIDYASVPLPDGNTLFTNFDVSDSTRIERALRERAEAFEEADQLKTEFLASVSYELRTPLNAMIGFTEILQNECFGKLNERQGEYVVDVLSSSQQLLELINDILGLATIEAGQMPLSIETIDVAELLASMAKLTERQVAQGELTLKLECPDDVGSFNADRNRIKQVLFNLLNNSIKFTPSGRTITCPPPAMAMRSR